MRIFLLYMSMFAVTLCSAQETKFPQFTVSLDGGRIGIKDGGFAGRPDASLYKSVIDSVENVLKENNRDTTALFLKALVKSQYWLTRYHSDEQLVELEDSARSIDSAFAVGMSNLTANVLRARIYYQLRGSLASDEGWRYSASEKAARKKKFERYRALSNRYHKELQTLDPENAYDYQKRIEEDASR